MIASGFTLLVILLALSLPVAVVLAVTGYILSETYAFFPMTGAAGELAWNSSNDFILIAAPMFIMMGELMHRSGISQNLFAALTPWFANVPGRLMHTNIAASAVFAATSGSSIATAATIGTVAIPNMDPGGYNRPLFLGSIAAGGTLGILIPPSINMIIYGSMTNTSIGRLFLAGIVPGLVMIALFLGWIALRCRMRPDLAGGVEAVPPLRERLARLRWLVPPVVIFGIVMGGIYGGLATPTEAAALGVLAALGLAAAERRLSIPMLHACFVATVRLSAMILLILVAASFLNFVIGIMGVPQALTELVSAFASGPVTVLLLLLVFYLVLGCFLETLSMMVATIPIVFPVVQHFGIDPVWFGVFLVIMMEVALITPPIGMNLYVVQGVRGRGAMSDVIRGASPYVAIMLGMIFLLIALPGLALWLPGRVF